MLKFVVRFFAVVGFLLIASIGALAALAAYGQNHGASEPNSVILTLDFTRPIVEQNDNSPIDIALHDDKGPVALLDVLRAIQLAKKDPHVRAIAARFGMEQPSLIQAQEIRDALDNFRTSGKQTYVFGTDFGEYGLGDRAYYLASAFDNIWLQPVGTVSLTGVAIQSPFAKAGLDKLGITADFMQREEYKSFMEPGQRDSFSPPVKAEMQVMAQDLSDQVANGIASSRKWDPAHVRDLMARGPYTDEEALQEGLVTRLAYADDLDDELDQKIGKDAKQVGVETYLSYAPAKISEDSKTKVALIYGTGIIAESSSGGDIPGEHMMSADDIASAFDDAADDKNVKAILFRIDSPGGSPAASETIRHAMIHAQKEGKPVIVSMGATAASGGYWIAMNGDHIVADPGSITGSIGVVAGKFANSGLLEKIGVTMDGVSTADNAGMWNMAAPFTSGQRARVNALLDNTYHAFVGDVSAARKIPMEKMPDIAKGRVWTGDQAIKIGLVDELGGYTAALADVRKTLKLAENAPLDLVQFPVPPTPAEKLLKLMRHMGAESAVFTSSMEMLGRLHTMLAPWLDSAFYNRPVMTMMGGAGIHD